MEDTLCNYIDLLSANEETKQNQTKNKKPTGMEHILNNTQENIDFVKQNQGNTRKEESKMRKDCPAIDLAIGFTWNLSIIKYLV